MKKTAVCVCSGGIDSTVTATIASREGYELHFFHTSYGQRAEKREKEAVQKIAAYLDAKELKLVKLTFLKELGGSSLTDNTIRVPTGEEVNLDEEKETPSTWVPCRNLVLLAFASAYAEVISADAIFVGFVERYNLVLEKAVASFSRAPTVKAPLVDLLKPAIIKKGIEVKAPLQLTYSCYLGGEKHCGICESCLHRRLGFEEAGVEDQAE